MQEQQMQDQDINNNNNNLNNNNNNLNNNNNNLNNNNLNNNNDKNYHHEISNQPNIDLSAYFETVQKLNIDLQTLKEENFKLLQQRPNMDEFESLDEAKKQIANEFNKLTEKHESLETNMQILLQKELIIIKREEEMNKIIKNYNNILNVSKYQIIIDSRFNNDNSETYNFTLEEKIPNVISLELVSYDVPNINYNITNNNNIFKYKFDQDIKTINVIPGVYDIDLLITKLNELSENLIFTVNFDQKITIKSINKQNFDLIDTELLMYILGFTNKEYKDCSEYNSETTYELRNDNYINLHITNIVSGKEFCTLNTNLKISDKKIVFDEPTEIEELDIAFTTYNNKPLSFMNKYHTLTFNIKALNNPIPLIENNNIEQ